MGDGFPVVRLNTSGDGSTFLSGDAKYPGDHLARWFPNSHAAALVKTAKMFNLCVGVARMEPAQLDKIRAGHPFLPAKHSYAEPITAKALHTQIVSLGKLKSLVKAGHGPFYVRLLPSEKVTAWHKETPSSNSEVYFQDKQMLDTAGVNGIQALETQTTLAIIDRLQGFMASLLKPHERGADGGDDPKPPLDQLHDCCAIWYDLTVGMPDVKGRRAANKLTPVLPGIRIPVALIAARDIGVLDEVVLVPTLPLETDMSKQTPGKQAKAFVKGYDLRFVIETLPDGDEDKAARAALLASKFKATDKMALLLRLQFMNIKPFGSSLNDFEETIKTAVVHIQRATSKSTSGAGDKVLPLTKQAFQPTTKSLRKPLEEARKIPDELLQQLSPAEKRLLGIGKAGKAAGSFGRRSNAKAQELEAKRTALQNEISARRNRLTQFVGKTVGVEPLAIFTPSGDLFLMENEVQVKKWVVALNLMESLKLAAVHLDRAADNKKTLANGKLILNLQSLGFPSMSQLRSVLDKQDHKEILRDARKANTCAEPKK